METSSTAKGCHREKKLRCMEELGVLSKVSESTEWCAGMVVVPKASGKVWICVDLSFERE